MTIGSCLFPLVGVILRPRFLPAQSDDVCGLSRLFILGAVSWVRGAATGSPPTQRRPSGGEEGRLGSDEGLRRALLALQPGGSSSGKRRSDDGGGAVLRGVEPSRHGERRGVLRRGLRVRRHAVCVVVPREGKAPSALVSRGRGVADELRVRRRRHRRRRGPRRRPVARRGRRPGPALREGSEHVRHRRRIRKNPDGLRRSGTGAPQGRRRGPGRPERRVQVHRGTRPHRASPVLFNLLPAALFRGEPASSRPFGLSLGRRDLG
mmetsp:Transcript_34669/g.111253  ORF Transcript_34669/g.111253 Transcript_34669/m.111253 type:complete len:264 (+) Transcript_34669:3-794(+)